jgi:hypothetical protein
VGASRYSGTEAVARLLYMGAVEHVSVTAINVTDEYANLSSAEVRAKLDAISTDAGQALVIDGGSVATAPQMLAVAERADQIVLVIRIGRDVAAEVEVLLHAIRNEDVPVTAICTKGRLPASERSSAGRRGRSDGGRHSLGSRAPASRTVATTPVAAGHGLPVDTTPSWTQTSWMSQETDHDQQFADDTVEVGLNGITPAEESEPSPPAATPETQTDEVDAEDWEDAAATLEAPEGHVDAPPPDDHHDEQSDAGHANGQAYDAPAADIVEPPTEEARSFGTGLRQRLQFRPQPRAQDGAEQETDPQTQDNEATERWESLLAHQGEHPRGESEQVHLNGQSHDAAPDGDPPRNDDDMPSSHSEHPEHREQPEHGDHQDDHGDRFQDH